MKKCLALICFTLMGLGLLPSCKHKQKALEPLAKHPSKSVSSKKTNPSPKTINKNAGEQDLKSILGVSSKEMRSNKLYAFIDEWYAVPYKYGGCKKTGVDCSCFVNLLYESVYHQKISMTAADIFKTSDKIELEQAKEGDFVFFKINGNSISHIGVLLKNKNFVHASTSKGVMVSSLNEAYFKKYFYCAGRMKNT